MNNTRCVLAATLLFPVLAFAANDLDKPIEPSRPTIRSEIYRGRDAADDCGLNPAKLLDCVFAIQSKNVQQNTSTDAFNTGMFFSVWLNAVGYEESVKKATGQEAKTDALRFFKSMKEYQAKLRIDNRSLCEAAGARCENVVPRMIEWELKLKAH